MTSIGIIGMGFMGRTHLEAYGADSRARVVAVADPRAERRAGRADGGNLPSAAPAAVLPPDVSGYDRAADLLDDDAVEAVSICVPTPEHAALATLALERGKHVLVEKPLALGPAEAARVVDAARASDRVCMPAMCIRFWPGWREAKEAIDDGRYGAVRTAAFRRVGGVPTWGEDFYLDAGRSGGAILDLHIHDADFVRYCFGNPDAIEAHGVVGPSGGVDEVLAAYRYRHGPPFVTAEGRWMPVREYPFSMRYEIGFESALLSYDSARGDEPLLLFRPDADPAPLPVAPGMGYTAEVAHFLDCIERGAPSPVVSIADGANAVALIDATRRSVETGAPVDFVPCA